MKTTNERLNSLEVEIVALRAALQIAGAAIVFPLQEALEQMVDEGLLAASTRNEIWGRVRKQAHIIGAGSPELSRGMSSAIPHYLTKDDVDRMKTRDLPFREVLRMKPKNSDE